MDLQTAWLFGELVTLILNESLFDDRPDIAGQILVSTVEFALVLAGLGVEPLG
jgi:hypothetical protein